MTDVSVQEAKTQLSRLIERALTGEDIIITGKGHPLVRLTPVKQQRVDRRPGQLAALFTVPDSFFEPLPRELRQFIEHRGSDHENSCG